MGAGTASACHQDADYVSCVAAVTASTPPRPERTGRPRAPDRQRHPSSGLRDPLQERDWVYYNTPRTISRIDANYLVNCATQIWLGFGSEGPGS